ncbi:class I adenylate-forming enzyme family protein [Rossellomorea vietnamensis]|uniref:class I adenylate-forming enzyme family protein n=1 Tax=Rossellomorea vietnamensis TaxID=218284 RepID=UPI0005525E06|nr:long-chain-fatty-acid--CoA ligase [Rossellomorea vietnamensis]
MNISELLSRNSRKYPTRQAVVTEGEEMTYRELDEKVNQLANSLKMRDIGVGDKVMLFMPNSAEFVISYFAVLRLGAIIVPVNAKLSPDELSFIVHHSDARAILAHEGVWETVESIELGHLLCIKTGKTRGSWKSFEDMLNEGSKEKIECTMSEEDDATILYTSGTTGQPKGVLFTYRNILTVSIMMCVEFEMKPESRILHMMPLSHSAPLHLFLIAGTYVGTTHILSPTFTPENLLKLVEQEQITHFFGAPVAYLFTSKLPDIQTYNLTSMKYWVYGGAPVSGAEIAYIKERLGTDLLHCVYGLTEAGPSGTLLGADEHHQKGGSIGKRGALGTEIVIVNEEGEPVDTNEVGEILLYGEGNMKGYYKDPEKTEEAFINGWLKTGDLARVDEQGYIWVVDRKKDMIISGGVNVYPKEIEELLVEHPDISEVAVVGVPHPEWGETVKAYVVSSLSSNELSTVCNEFLKGKLASYKTPKLYESLHALPRNATGKILKQPLRDMTQEVNL